MTFHFSKQNYVNMKMRHKKCRLILFTRERSLCFSFSCCCCFRRCGTAPPPSRLFAFGIKKWLMFFVCFHIKHTYTHVHAVWSRTNNETLRVRWEMTHDVEKRTPMSKLDTRARSHTQSHWGKTHNITQMYHMKNGEFFFFSIFHTKCELNNYKMNERSKRTRTKRVNKRKIPIYCR